MTDVLEILTGGYIIRSAKPEHLPFLNDIELAAAALFPAGFLPEHILSECVPSDALACAMEKNMLFVAEAADGTPVGYAFLQTIEDHAFLAEIDVHPAHGQRGIGSALIRYAVESLRKTGWTELYLTTFAHIKWNAPFYEKLGFRTLDAKEQPLFIRNILLEEHRRGLSSRVAMKLSF